jgi:hypothetical protein
MVTKAAKLIDLGAVSRVNSFGYLYGTPLPGTGDRPHRPDRADRHLHGRPRWRR